MEVTQAILHILDLDSGALVFSQKELNLGDYPVKTYLQGVLKKFSQGEAKLGQLHSGNPLFQTITQAELGFLANSQAVAQAFFDCLTQGEEIPSGDLLYFTGEKAGDPYVGMIKLNYKPAFTHFVDYEDETMINRLIINQTILPNASQKIEEGVLINLASGDFELIEKKYKFDGRNRFYFSEELLKTEAKPTVQENIKIVKKAVKEIADKYNEENYVSLSHVQQAVYESIESEGKLNNEKIAEAVFEHNISAKAEYLERVERTNYDENIPVNVPKYEKKFSKQKLKLANGIEMLIPLEVYQDKDLIEFINNPDGTISVIIKNVDEIINKF